uniref:BTB domain-containing protein n=1 Tax=Panagrellus redivivus TaxID=6233 RepID=A0A7E4VB64_PANRE
MGANGGFIVLSKFSHSIEGKVSVEGKGLPRKTETFPKCKKFEWIYLPVNIVCHAMGTCDVLEIKVIVDVNIDVDFVPEIRTYFHEYNEILTDFEIQAEDEQYKVHKDVLSQISPVFEAMLRHNFVETSSNTLEINDLDFETIETAMNICYGCPWKAISVKVAIKILYFADKYAITDIFVSLKILSTVKLSYYDVSGPIRIGVTEQHFEHKLLCRAPLCRRFRKNRVVFQMQTVLST